MKISYNWLRDYLNISLPPNKLGEILTNTGLEVEGIEEFESVKGGMKGLVVGEVITCKPHPNADKLSLTTVNLGNGKVVPVVCGAPNVAAGQKVVVATVGTSLNINDDSFVIKKVKIRGQVSEGMICAEDEIGIGSDHEGIIVLDPGAKPGTAAGEYFDVFRDDVFEIGLTPNRIDGASHIGAARDVAAALKPEMSVVFSKPGVESFRVDRHTLEIPVDIRNAEACIRYSGIGITGVKVGESPGWIKNRLKAIGLKPINNIVDITNYVLHETGQPLHAFDADKITGGKVIVRTLPDKTKFTSLDEVVRELSDEDLMICNAGEAMCIAGVFGGIDSGVSENTKNVFLESACFNPVWIRRTSKRHGLNTDSSFRFERGSDPNGTIFALKRAAILVRDIAGGQISSDIIDVYPKQINPCPVRLKWSNLDRLVGMVIPRESVKEILRSLDINIINQDKDGLNLEVATYRVDVTREADVIEEILRIYGYNTIGLHDQVYSTLSYSRRPDPDQMENLISEQLVARGFLEIMANSLTKSSYYENNESFGEADTVKLLNPLSSDLGVMRQSLLYGGLEAIALNIKHRNRDLKLYEFGNIYRVDRKKNVYSAESYIENRNLMILLTGSKTQEHWNTKQTGADYFQLKAYVKTVLERMGIDYEALDKERTVDTLFSEGQVYKYHSLEIAKLGSLSQKLLEAFDIDQDVFFAGLNWDLILKKSSQEVKYRELTRYPSVRRDLALVVDGETEFESIRKLAFSVEKKLLKDVSLFDVFESEKLGPGKKSYAVSFIIQDDFKTLTDNRVDKVMSNLLSAFQQKLGARLR